MNSEEISRDLSGILQLGFVVDIQLSLGASIKSSKAPQMWWGSRHGFHNITLWPHCEQRRMAKVHMDHCQLIRSH